MNRKIGELLRDKRENSGLSTKDLAARTRISKKYIIAIEEGSFEDIPGAVFITGFIRSISAELDIDADSILDMLEENGMDEDTDEEVSTGNRRFLPMALTAGVLVALVIGGGFFFGEQDQEGSMEVEQNTEKAVVNVPVTNNSEELTVLEEEVHQELSLIIRAIDKTWLRIQADASDPWETSMRAGDEVSVKAMDKITMFIGNAGGLQFELNGRRFGPPGSLGQVISNYVITRDNL